MANYNFSNCSLERPSRSENITESIDQFPATEFFRDKLGNPIPAHIVGMNLQSNPELKEKVAQYIVQNEIQSSDLSEEEIMTNIQQRYEDKYSLIKRLSEKSLELRKKEIEAKVDNELNKK